MKIILFNDIFVLIKINHQKVWYKINLYFAKRYLIFYLNFLRICRQNHQKYFCCFFLKSYWYTGVRQKTEFYLAPIGVTPPTLGTMDYYRL